jgi:hypothetical protein
LTGGQRRLRLVRAVNPVKLVERISKRVLLPVTFVLGLALAGYLIKLWLL